jgi:hypothetical protein
MRVWHKIILCIGVLFVLYSLFAAIRQPSNDREWRVDQAVLPTVTVEGNLVHVRNVRNFTYTSTEDYTPAYYDRTYDLNTLTGVDFIVEPIADWDGAAHTFYSFNFAGQHLVTSVEARKEKNEQYSTWQGMLRSYELMYMYGDEHDLIYLRAIHRNHSVFLYPINTTPEKTRLLFLDIVKRTNDVQQHPEFYNTLTNTCTTNLVEHANAVTPHKVPWSFSIIAPGYSDSYAYELGLINTTLPPDEIRHQYNITPKAQTYESGDFSAWIRN